MKKEAMRYLRGIKDLAVGYGIVELGKALFVAAGGYAWVLLLYAICG